MKRVIFSVMFAIVLSVMYIPSSFAGCDKAKEMYGNNQMSKSAMEAICNGEKSAPQSVAATAPNAEKPKRKTPKPAQGQPTPPAPATAQGQPTPPAPATASTDVMNAIGALKTEIEAMKAEANKAKQVQSESLITKLDKNKVAIYSLGTLFLIPLMIVIIILQLRNRKGMAALARKIQSLSGP